jgi:hypothetical protein
MCLPVKASSKPSISISYNGRFASGATNQGVLGALNIAF